MKQVQFPMCTATCLLVMLAAGSVTGVSAARNVNSVNPIRRVITMLQMMQDKVAKEGEKEQHIFDKYMCYCDKSHNALDQSIAAAESKMPQLGSSINENQAEHDRLNGDIEQAKNDRRDAADSLATAQALSKKMLAKLSTDIDQYRSNIKALSKAILALEKGRVNAFLQSSAVGQLHSLIANLEMSASDRDLILSFLSTDKSDDSYKPNPSEILGILKQLLDSMHDGLEKAIADEKDETEQAAAMTKSKNEQITALSKQIEAKTQRVGELGVDIENLQGDYDDTGKSLDDDKLFLQHLDKACDFKQKHWNERTRIRLEELAAITQTIKVLNDDETLTLFKKTLPAPNFLQVAQRHGHRRAPGDGTREKAINALQGGAQRGQHRSQMQAISMAMRNKRTSFEKIIKMIGQMVELLKSEEGTDIKKNEYCKKEMGTSENQMKALNSDASDIQKAMEEGQNKLAAISEEISALGEGITQLDEQVKESTKQRKEEHAEFLHKLALNTATKDLLALAKNLLHKFYNPKLYEDPQQPEEPFFVQVAASKRKQLPGSPPNADIISASYDKSAGGSKQVINMIDLLSQDVAKETSQMQVDEKSYQTSYEEAMQEAAAKRAIDARAIAEKEAVKAELEMRLHKMTKEKKAKTKQAFTLSKLLESLHTECDWLLANFDARLEARDAEVKSLNEAKAVLSDADYSLQQRDSKS